MNFRSRFFSHPGFVFTTKLLLDGFAVCFAYVGAFLLRMDGHVPDPYQAILVHSSPALFALTVSVMIAFHAFQMRWRYTGIRDAARLTLALFVIAALFFPALYMMGANVPRSIPFLFVLLGTSALIGQHGAFRVAYEAFTGHSGVAKRTLIVGAGNAGEMIVRQILSGRELGLVPVGFVDDDPKKLGSRIHGVQVVGTVEDLPDVVRRRAVEFLILAVPSATPAEMRRIVEFCQRTGVTFKTVPGPRELVNGKVYLDQLREIQVEDLLDREPVRVDTAAIRAFFRQKRVLVTGAAGSIGSELCRQIVAYAHVDLLAIDRSENGLFYLESELQSLKSDSTKYDLELCDVREIQKFARYLGRFRPDIIFHAAAFKHVPIVERNVSEGFENNFLATVRLAKAAERVGAQKFVFISTDKAVRPTSVMGATKRAAEIALNAMDSSSATSFVTVRFGNVLASQGSVVPLFRRQIERGGPVTVTHPEMRRFFMTIPEAVRLILEAARLGNGGELFILDMGDPIRIVELARHVIRLSGLEPDKDIPIVFTGIRPGEKLYEELWYPHEQPEPTEHPKILRAKTNGHLSWDEIEEIVTSATRHASVLSDDQVKALLITLVPEYKPGDPVVAQQLIYQQESPSARTTHAH